MEIEVVGITFDDSIKPFYFAPNGFTLKKGDKVVVETSRGLELGNVVGQKSVTADEIVGELKPVVRIATAEDINTHRELKKESLTLLPAVKKIVKSYMPDVKVSFVKFNLDHSKMIVTYTSDERVDYRELVRKLASEFHTRIEMRQIGYRDEVAMMGALGPCGEVCCCNRFLLDFDKVSIKMAKEQGIALTPNKINGMCGRLLCCLKYEEQHYRETLQRMPKVNARVNTPDGEGKVVFNDILREKCIVMFNKDDSIERKEYALEEIVFDKPTKPNKDETNV